MKKLALLVSMVVASNFANATMQVEKTQGYELTNASKFNGLVETKNYEILNIADITEDVDMFGVIKQVAVEHKSKNDKYQLFTYEVVDCASKTRLITQYATFDITKNKFYMYSDILKQTKTSKNLKLEELVVNTVCGNNMYEAL